MKTFLLYTIGILCAFNSHAQKKDFGNNGLKGLSAAQQQEIAKGEVVLLNDGKGDGNSLIEAALVFNAAPETTWKLLSRTEDQTNYIKECKEIKVISQSPTKAVQVHTVGNALANFTYGVLQYYDPANKYIHWSLDPGYKDNDLTALNGYWQFYPYGKGKTLARYGSTVSFKSVPDFVENMFKKGGVKDALGQVKKYVDSGGTYHK